MHKNNQTIQYFCRGKKKNLNSFENLKWSKYDEKKINNIVNY